jgi:hypothetical protein
MQRNTIFFIAVKALHVSGRFPAHPQELKNCTRSIWYLLSLVASTDGMVEMEISTVKNIVLCCILLVTISICEISYFSIC